MPTPKNSDATKAEAKTPAKSTVKPRSAENATPQPTDIQPKPDRQSQLATILIGLLIIASGLLLYNYFQNASAPATKTTVDQTQSPTSTPKPSVTQQAKASPTPTPTPAVASNNQNQATNNQANYTVQAGDSLWTIAQKVYGSGFDWNKIDQANHINRNAAGQPMLVAGQQLIIPGSAAATSTTTTPSQVAANNQQLTQTPATAIQTYTVKHGDTLWSIAQAEYGKGSDWVKIFNDSQNNLSLRPDGVPLIHAGNVLVIPQIE